MAMDVLNFGRSGLGLQQQVHLLLSKCQSFCRAFFSQLHTSVWEFFIILTVTFAIASGSPSPSFLLGGLDRQLHFCTVLNVILQLFSVMWLIIQHVSCKCGYYTIYLIQEYTQYMGVFKMIILKLTFFYLQFQCEMHLTSFYTITLEDVKDEKISLYVHYMQQYPCKAARLLRFRLQFSRIHLEELQSISF